MGAANATELINDTWSKDNLIGAMFPASNVPQIVSLNAHYDHFRSLPADENAANRETIFTTADLLARSTGGRVVFTMGCHSALPVSDFVVGDVLNPDWAQAYAQTGAVVYMGNTGFGLGDTAAVLYSEKLNVLFAERLDGLDDRRPGARLREAGVRGDADAERLPPEGDRPGVDDGPADVPRRDGCRSHAADPRDHVDRLGDRAADRLVQRLAELHPGRHPDRRLLRLDDAFAENRRPIEPTTKLDITQPGLVAHGALITGLDSADEAGFDAAFSRVVDDLSGFTLSSSATSPSRPSCSRSPRSRPRPGLASGWGSSPGNSGVTASPRRSGSVPRGGSLRCRATSSARASGVTDFTRPPSARLG